MDLLERLHHFMEETASEHMPDAAARLVELLESDQVEPLGAPGKRVPAEDVADRLEERMRKMQRRGDVPAGIELLEDAVAHLRAVDGAQVLPFAFEDGDGVRWFVLADEADDVVACYTSEPFVEAEV
ncbi:MAG TPA: hypothetical protein RMG48_17470 [Myxococcales bacterium LLY-WYZ-16_1]|jgi:hypothetical protein|nr:hypothetical protein [Myxococcales bacterium LLY-WYZ-16_1]